MTESVEPRHPGRWLGGLVGALLSLAVSAVGLLMGEDPIEASAIVGIGGLVGLGVAGLPVGFLLGRALLPAARSQGIAGAVGVGLAFGLAAPPLGAIVVLLGLAIPVLAEGGLVDALAVLLLLPYAFVFSYVASVATVPAGIVWGAVVRLLPEAVLVRAAVGPRLGRVGARHVVAVGLVAWLGIGLVPYAVDATDGWACTTAYTSGHSWSADGQRIVATGGLEPYGQSVISIDRSGEADILRETLGGPLFAVGGPGGVTAWIESVASARGGDELWIADGEGHSLNGRLPGDAWVGLAWWDGSWVSIGARSGLSRLSIGGSAVSAEPVLVRGQRVGIGDAPEALVASADGRRLAWEPVPGDGWLAILEPGRFDRIRLPDRAFEPSLEAGGEAITYRDGWDGDWRRMALGSNEPEPEIVAGARWAELRIGPGGVLAARSEQIHDGRLCIAGTP